MGRVYYEASSMGNTPVAMYGLKNVVEHRLLGNAGKGAVLW